MTTDRKRGRALRTLGYFGRHGNGGRNATPLTPKIQKRAYNSEMVRDTANVWGPEIAYPIITKIANSSRTVRDREKVTSDHLLETGVGLSES